MNGDYWVVGPVTVKSVSPMPENRRNGSMINPKPATTWSSNDAKQAYDDRVAVYNSSKESVPSYDESLAVKYPITLSADKSLVSTISLKDSDLVGGKYITPWGTGTVSPSNAYLKTAAVLTVLGSVPPAGSFRPPYVGDSKPLYNISQIQRQYLRQLAAPKGVSPKENIQTFYERGFERPWIFHMRDWMGRSSHPVDNMPNYHEYIGKLLSEASLIMLTNLSTDKLEKGFIQTGIDIYHTVSLGVADSSYFEFQVMYTGLLLNDNAMINIAKSGAKYQGRTSEKFYYWNEKQSTIVSAKVSAGKTWTGATVFFKKQGGNGEYEHLHPSEWGLAEPGGSHGGIKHEAYRQGNDSIAHMGMLLASRLVGATNKWATNAPNDYLVRWMTEAVDFSVIEAARAANGWTQTVPNNTKNMGSDFMNAMWNTYKNYNGLGSGNNNPVTETNYNLTVSVNGQGSVSGNDNSYTRGSIATLTANPGAGYSFSSWSGCSSTNGNVCTVTMNSNTSVTVNFSQNQTPAFSIGNRVMVSAIDGVNVRISANATSEGLGNQAYKNLGTIENGPINNG